MALKVIAKFNQMEEQRILVISEVDVLKARRIGREMAKSFGFDEIGMTEIEVAISELATNLIKHRTINGEIIIKPLFEEDRVGMELRSEDQGPGIKDLDLAMKGEISTAGTFGIGLSGVKRMMDEFSIESKVGHGTIVVAKKWLRQEAIKRMAFSVYSRPMFGEEVSGDAYFIKQTPSFSIFGLIDVLGHGREAHELSLTILRILQKNYKESLLKIIDISHWELKHSRGAAMALCRINFGKNVLEHISIGNVETRVYGTPTPIRPFCFNGTLGMAMENHRVIEYPFNKGATIVMFSDGISGRFDLSAQILSKTPQEIAAYIFDNFARGNDDATVLVGR